jgi:phosphatidylserine/phosphatidylglycerophosphate/cardiolipin synthase-like enzyme
MTRTIQKSSSTAATEVADLLESVFTRLALFPDRCVWIVSPWISDISVVDQRFGVVPNLEGYGRRRLTLFEVLGALAKGGTTVVVALRDDKINQRTLQRLKALASDHRLEGRLFVHPTDNNHHDKTMVGDDFVITGSMNFTVSGTAFNDERVEYSTAPGKVAEAQLDLHDRFPGRLDGA